MKGKVIIYGAPWCHACKSAKAWLAQHGIHYTYVDVDEMDDTSGLESIGVTSLPTLFYGDIKLVGFMPKEYKEVFENVMK